MVTQNQANITIPSGIVTRIDEFLDTDTAGRLGLTSRPQVVIMLLRDFLKNPSGYEFERIDTITVESKKKDYNLVFSIKDKTPSCMVHNFQCECIDELFSNSKMLKTVQEQIGFELLHPKKSEKIKAK